MAQRKEVGVIGLGKFGFCLAETLMELGHQVIGVDKSESRVRVARDALTQVYQADAMDKVALQQLGFGELEFVVVSIGGSMEASILITMNLKELGTGQVWVKAVSRDHEKVLNKIGADFVVFPERFVARQLAHRLAVPGLLNYLPLGGGIVLQEFNVDKWAGQTLRELDLPNRHHLLVVAVKRPGEDKPSFIPRADVRLEKGDVLVAIGGDEDRLGEG